MHSHRPFLGLALAILATALTSASTTAKDPIVFITSFASGDDGGIHAYAFDTKVGKLKPLHRTAIPENPFFLALSPNQKFLYSTHTKQFGGTETEHVAAYEIVGRTGELKLLNRQSCEGRGACHLNVEQTGKTVLVSNYTSGNVASLPVKADGSLGAPASFFQHEASRENPSRPKKPLAHCIVVSPENRYAYVADKGLDRIYCYKLDPAQGTMTPNTPPFTTTQTGAGPRHLRFHPNGKRVYVINELSNSVSVYTYDAGSGALTETQTIPTLPKDFSGRTKCADLKITPDGRYLYGTNRGHDSIACYRIAEDGTLSLIAIESSLGKEPQNLAITDDGSWLLCANRQGNSVAVFHIDGMTGRLKSAGEPISQPKPSCIMLQP